MAITTRDQLINALANNSSRVIIDKANLANQAAGGFTSLWRATGQPAQGAIPTTAALCTSALLGSIGFANQTPPATSYFGHMFLVAANGILGTEIHDRLAHLGGLVLNVTTAQTITGLDLLTLAPSAARLGSADYSDCQWWLEVYADGGATASNATINVTYDDGSTGNLNTVAVGGTLRASRMLPLTPLIPVAQQGRFIRGINSVTLSASTTVAGNFGFTCTRVRAALPTFVVNKVEQFTWSMLGLPEIANDACLMILALCNSTSTNTLKGSGKIIHG